MNSFSKRQEIFLQNEIYNDIENDSLTTLLQLIQYLFHSPKDYFVSQQIKISPFLLQLFSTLSDEHPDFVYYYFLIMNSRRIKDMLLLFAEQNAEIGIYILKRLISFKTDYSNHYTVILDMIDHIIDSNYSMLSIHPLLLVYVSTRF